jgi:hypothetical protein
MEDGEIPYYGVGQTYKFVIEEIEDAVSLEQDEPPLVIATPSESPSSGVKVPFADLSPADLDIGGLL